LWDLTSTQPLWTLPEATKTTVLHVRATSLLLLLLLPFVSGAHAATTCQYDNQKILTGSQDVTVYDAKSGKTFYTQSAHPHVDHRHPHHPSSITLHPSSGVKVCALPLAEPTISLACLNSFYTLVSTAHGSLLWDLRMPQSYVRTPPRFLDLFCSDVR
jgi:hypothetical protein